MPDYMLSKLTRTIAIVGCIGLSGGCQSPVKGLTPTASDAKVLDVLIQLAKRGPPALCSPQAIEQALLVSIEASPVRRSVVANSTNESQTADISPRPGQLLWQRGRYEHFTSQALDRCSVWLRVSWPRLCENVWSHMEASTKDPGHRWPAYHGAAPSPWRIWRFAPDGSPPNLPYSEWSMLQLHPRPDPDGACIAEVELRSRS